MGCWPPIACKKVEIILLNQRRRYYHFLVKSCLLMNASKNNSCESQHPTQYHRSRSSQSNCADAKTWICTKQINSKLQFFLSHNLWQDLWDFDFGIMLYGNIACENNRFSPAAWSKWKHEPQNTSLVLMIKSTFIFSKIGRFWYWDTDRHLLSCEYHSTYPLLYWISCWTNCTSCTFNVFPIRKHCKI